ncbi:maltose ABC transporter permease MalF [Maritalea sp.]|jgi:maltose/maltodextrin transport system permease protein|uniref:maltose ABC transporter permease MalF n=1 Tax=Maritalea sp. TaxID=2003361 RepID=UPI0039E306BF
MSVTTEDHNPQPNRAATSMISLLVQTLKPFLRLASLTAIALAFLYVIWGLYLAGEPIFAVVAFALGISIVILFGWARFYTWRFVFPGVAAIAVFIVLPVLYTSGIGFTNYSASNILPFERVQQIHLDKMVKAPDSGRPFALTEDLRLYFAQDDGRPALITGPLGAAEDDRLIATPYEGDAPETQNVKAVLQNRAALQKLIVELPDGGELTMDGLREFATSAPFYTLDENENLNGVDGTVLVPNHEKGFYQNEADEMVTPGWPVGVGWANFTKVLFADGIRQPMLEIFIWTCAFAFLSMVFTSGLGTMLAVVLEWEHLAYKAIYKIFLILPYAVPAFISILVFRGLFNQNFGEINLILGALFGLEPDWFTNPTLTRSMLLLVNTWLGFPYWMLISAGFLQSVPRDHFKAAALENSGPVRNFFAITLPQIMPPMVPLLIANFAFNFNNIVLVLLLTRGGPDIPGTIIPAGSTDLLGSFTFRIAFQNSGQDFGLAGAISTLIFIITGIIAYVNYRAMQRLAAKRSARS